VAIPFIGDLIDGVKDIVSEVVVDKDKRDQVNLELKKLEDNAQARLDAQVTGQIEINKVEAGSDSTFVAGWRPAVGWVGAAGFAWITLLQPMLSWFAAVTFGYVGGFPTVNADILIYMLSGLLGFGGLRTFEKYKGVAGTGTMENKSAPQTETEVTLASGDTISTKTTPPPVPVQVAPSVKKKRWSF